MKNIAVTEEGENKPVKREYVWQCIISESDIETCRNFATACFTTNKDEYARRGQVNRVKIIQDITIGKMAELGAYHFLTDSRKVDCSPPDFLIYSSQEKNYGADINFVGTDGLKYELHVKAQTKDQSQLFGKSWLFQKSDSLTYAPKFNEIICLCTIDENVFQLNYIKAANKFLGVYSQPKCQHLWGTKIILCAENIYTTFTPAPVFTKPTIS